MAPTNSAIAIIAGAGPGTGYAVAKKFAVSYPVALLSRNPETYEPLVKEIEANGGKAIGISTDVSSEESVKSAFAKIKSWGKDEKGGEVKVAAAIFNASGKFVKKPFLELSLEEFNGSYQISGQGAFLFAQQSLALLEASVPDPPSKDAYNGGAPTLIFTGATASVKGSAQFAPFAAGKWGVRAIAQSTAREFGPKGVHVAHAIIDGVIDIPRTKDWQLPGGPNAKISADAIADAYWHLHTQPLSTFTFEIDIRPHVEKW